MQRGKPLPSRRVDIRAILNQEVDEGDVAVVNCEMKWGNLIQVSCIGISSCVESSTCSYEVFALHSFEKLAVEFLLRHPWLAHAVRLDWWWNAHCRR